MIETSAAYKAAVTADARRVRLKIPLRISSSGMSRGALTSSARAPMSKLSQVKDDNVIAEDSYVTLEQNRWILDGSLTVLPDSYAWSGEVGFISTILSGGDNTFATPPFVTMAVSGINILQALTIVFPDNLLDGWPTSFTVEISQGGSAIHTQTVTDCTGGIYYLTGFTVYNPDSITISFNSWSLPYTRARLIELYPGYAADWTEDDLVSASVKMQASFSGVTVPYGSASLVIDNTSGTFSPRSKDGIFESLEERMAVDIYMGVELPDESTEYIPVGVYYKHNKAWATQNDGLTMRWDFVDIIGLLVDTAFVVPSTLPTTLSGWVKAICASLGSDFRNRYSVDPAYASAQATVESADAVEGMMCKDVLRFVCQYTGTFARADQETGYLCVEPYWSQGNEYDLDNLNQTPEMVMNDDLATITFQLGTGSIVISGNESTSSNNVSLKNPFVQTQTQALQAAQTIFETYGGNIINTTGRGDPSSEIGDVATIQIDEATAVTGRIRTQSFSFSDGVLKGCQTELVQPTGQSLYENREVITESGTWTAPAGVSSLFVVLVGGGEGGADGTEGDYYKFPVSEGMNYGNPGDPGDPGEGAKIFYTTININEGQTFTVTIGNGGVAGGSETTPGRPTTFGSYSSANGHTYTPSYTDIYSGSAFGRTGVDYPKANTGDGGAGGAAGGAGSSYWQYQNGALVLKDTYPGKAPGWGKSGASGCVIVYWEEDET